MNYKDYNQYQDSMAEVFRDLNDELEKMYAEDDCLSLRFLETSVMRICIAIPCISASVLRRESRRLNST